MGMSGQPTVEGITGKISETLKGIGTGTKHIFEGIGEGNKHGASLITESPAVQHPIDTTSHTGTQAKNVTMESMESAKEKMGLSNPQQPL